MPAVISSSDGTIKVAFAIKDGATQLSQATPVEMTLAEFQKLLLAKKPAIAALNSGSTAAQIVAALQA